MEKKHSYESKIHLKRSNKSQIYLKISVYLLYELITYEYNTVLKLSYLLFLYTLLSQHKERCTQKKCNDRVRSSNLPPLDGRLRSVLLHNEGSPQSPLSI